jgi:glycosyltransferase involved in cell wall biosynthesis
MQTITAVIPAKNEGENIARCIESVKWCNKIVVMWMGNDETGETAKKLGAEVIKKNASVDDDFTGVQKNINWAIDHCETDWILRIDADEVVTNELESEIKSILAPGGRRGRAPDSVESRGIWSLVATNPDGRETSDRIWREEIVAYGIPRAQFFCGGFLRGGDWAYDRLVRFFKPKYCRYEPIVPVHEQFRVNGKIGYLKNKLLHYSHPTFKEAVKKFQLYTDIEAKNMKDHYAVAALKMFFLPAYVFLRWMIWHHGYRDGLRGLLAGAMRGWYEFLVYSKYLLGEK